MGRKRRQVPVSPRWLGEALKGILREKAGRLIIKGDLKAPELDELSKIVTLLDRPCSQGWDMRAAALEVMDRFIEFLRRWVKDPEELKQISYRVQEFVRTGRILMRGGRPGRLPTLPPTGEEMEGRAFGTSYKGWQGVSF